MNSVGNGDVHSVCRFCFDSKDQPMLRLQLKQMKVHYRTFHYKTRRGEKGTYSREKGGTEEAIYCFDLNTQ